MSKDIDLYVGFTLEGTEAQLKYWDDDAGGLGAFVQVTIPAGTYYFKHDTAAKDLVAVLDTLLGAIGGGGAGIARANDRQVEWTMDDPLGDFVYLKETTNDDAEKIAEALGLYDNTGDLTYYETTQIDDGYVNQVTLTGWFDEGGRVLETYDLGGFETFNNEIYVTEGGESSQISGQRVATVGPLTFDMVTGYGVRSGWPTCTQSVLGTTLVTDQSTSIWRALHPRIREPRFYMEWGDTPEKYEFSMTAPLMRENVIQRVANWNGRFRVGFTVNCTGGPY